MKIEKELVEEAKRKLGDENAFWMAELLDLEKFDNTNLKSCCPYHDEKTPSFVYDKKQSRFHCFSCAKTVDIVDVLIERKHLTFLEAVEAVFNKTDIKFSFGEKDVRTKTNYRYPKEESLTDRVNVIDYLGKRGISKGVIDYLDIREDSQGNAVFNFYDTNDVLTVVKYRPSHSVSKESGQPKTWCQKNADTTPLLFNMNRINTAKPLLICEGEIDCASVVESGYMNVVSVPLGAGNLHWIEENFGWLEMFDEIIIWSDNDEAGEKMRKECVYRLGTWRTKYIVTPSYFEKIDGRRIPLKDANDCLQIGGKDFVMELISGAKDVPVKSVVDYSDIDDLDLSEMDGVVTGIKPIDDELVKIFYGTLTILSGRPGSGKTSIIDQTIAHTIDSGIPVFLFSKEMPERMSANWFNSIIAGRRNLDTKIASNGNTFYVVNPRIKKKMQDFYKSKLLIYKDDEPNDVDSIMHSAEECVRKYGAKLIVLDNLMMIDLECSEADKNTAQTALINRLIKFASKFNVAVVLISHPRKTQDMSSDIEMYDIAGSSNIINLAMRSIGLRRVSKKEKEDPKSEWKNFDVVATIMKDRMFGKSDWQCGLWYDLPSRRFYTNYSEYDAKYAWDDNVYANRIPYIDRAAVNPEDVFPDGR